MPDSTSTALARNPESSARAALRVVPRPVPQPTDLPLPDPPRRPFIALARMCVVGGPMLKHVFMVVTSYCPVMASDWEARGFALRETLRRDCEFAKVETLDRYLKLLQLAGWIDWTHQWGHGTRGQSASEFLVRLSPVQVADRIRPPRQGGQLGPNVAARRELHTELGMPLEKVVRPAVRTARDQGRRGPTADAAAPAWGSLPELPINKDPHVREQRPPCAGITRQRPPCQGGLCRNCRSTKTPMSGNKDPHVREQRPPCQGGQ